MMRPHHRRTNTDTSQQWLPRHVASVTRRVGMGPHVLRRPVDRLEHIVVLAALALVLAATPLAVAVSMTVNHHNQVLSAAQTADRTRGTATLLATVPLTMQLEGAEATVQAAARWRTPAGAIRVGDIPVRPGSVAGQPIAIWLDSAGHRVDRPLTAAEARWQSVLAGIFTMAAVIALLTVVVVIVRRRLDRVRLSGWAAEWRRVEPRWTQRRS
jgi:hypothetical protein